VKKLEKEALEADRNSVMEILSDISADDYLGQMSFRSRLDDIEKQLRELESTSETLGKVALLFGGAPVTGSRGINAKFAGDVVSQYQDLVAKRVAQHEVGRLGARGPIPFRYESTLALTDVIRGSIGFMLEESAENESLVETTIKKAIDEVTGIIRDTSSAIADDFERIVESLDPRLLGALRSFLASLDEGAATVRIVDAIHDETFDKLAIKRARERVEMTEIEERDDETIVGILHGLLPHSRRFELELSDTHKVITGTVAATVASKYDEMNGEPTKKTWRVKMRIREIRERNKPARSVYTLIGLLEEVAAKAFP
jgi:hypothetical protein